jgi:hypothetical protein
MRLAVRALVWSVYLVVSLLLPARSTKRNPARAPAQPSLAH